MVEPPPYRSDCGPLHRPARWGELPDAVGVLDEEGKLVGMALAAGARDDGAAMWRLVVRGEEVEERWVLRGRRFEPA